MANKKTPLKVLHARIQDALDTDGGYSHNIISIVLRHISSEHGVKAANEAIEEFDLEDLGWEKEKE